MNRSQLRWWIGVAVLVAAAGTQPAGQAPAGAAPRPAGNQDLLVLSPKAKSAGWTGVHKPHTKLADVLARHKSEADSAEDDRRRRKPVCAVGLVGTRQKNAAADERRHARVVDRAVRHAPASPSRGASRLSPPRASWCRFPIAHSIRSRTSVPSPRCASKRTSRAPANSIQPTKCPWRCPASRFTSRPG